MHINTSVANLNCANDCAKKKKYFLFSQFLIEVEQNDHAPTWISTEMSIFLLKGVFHLSLHLKK
jgi:hypothetical protein